MMLAVCNGAFAGGGMRFAPAARLNDGQLHLTIIEHRRFMPALKLMSKLYLGDVTRLPGVQTHKAMKLTVAGPALDLEVDGDLIGTLPATFTVVPRALSVIGIDAQHLISDD